jgi:hypothetical protein
MFHTKKKVFVNRTVINFNIHGWYLVSPRKNGVEKSQYYNVVYKRSPYNKPGMKF